MHRDSRIKTLPTDALRLRPELRGTLDIADLVIEARLRFWSALRVEFAGWIDDGDKAAAGLDVISVAAFTERLGGEPGEDRNDVLGDDDRLDA